MGPLADLLDARAKAVEVPFKLADVPVMHDGRQIWMFEVYLGAGYQATDTGGGT